MLCRHILYQLPAVTCQVAKFALSFGRNKTAFEKTCTKQLAYPGGVLLVCLVPGNILDVAGIDHKERQTFTFQDVEHWLPINSSTFHRNMGDT